MTWKGCLRRGLVQWMDVSRLSVLLFLGSALTGCAPYPWPGRVCSPGTQEVCNGQDDDCDGEVDDAVTTPYYRDRDGDGFGGAEVVLRCHQPDGYDTHLRDCNDEDAAIYPEAMETCGDGVDNDCDPATQESCTRVQAFVSQDEIPPPFCPCITPLRTVQEAIEAVPDGGIIAVGPGIYDGSVNFGSRSLTLYSLEGAAKTILRSEGGSVVSFGPGADGRLEGFTITRGRGTACSAGTCGGGVLLTGASPTLRDLIVRDNESDSGGGIFVRGGAPKLENVQVLSNRAINGAGIYFEGSQSAVVQLSVCGNRASGGTDGQGGGLMLGAGAVVRLSHVWIQGNRADNGGGIAALSDTSMSMTQGILRGNFSAASGGAVQTVGAALTFQHVTVAGNCAPLGNGAAFELSGAAAVWVSRSIIAHNFDAVQSRCTGEASLLSEDTNEGFLLSESLAIPFPESASCGDCIVDEDPAFVGDWSSRGSAGDAQDDVHLTACPSPDTSSTGSPLEGTQAGTASCENSPAVDSGYLGGDSALDPDGSAGDLGAFGGSEADGWDLDGDGVFLWYWTGSFDAMPDGVDTSRFQIAERLPAECMDLFEDPL